MRGNVPVRQGVASSRRPGATPNDICDTNVVYSSPKPQRPDLAGHMTGGLAGERSVDMAGEFVLAFLAGVVSFVSPCCLPMAPMYISYLAGLAGGDRAGAMGRSTGRWLVIMHAACFVGGFTMVFVALGASASVLGELLRTHLILVRHVSGLLIIGLGLHTAGLLRIPWLYRDFRPRVRPVGGGGVARSGLLGVAFGAGWTPCVGPMLGSILLLSSTSTTLGEGVSLLFVYALGLGVPFLIAAAAIHSARGVFRRLGRYHLVITWFSAALLVTMGVMVYEGTFVQMARLFPVGL